MDARTYLRMGGTIEEAIELGNELRYRGPTDRVERAAQILTDGARVCSMLLTLEHKEGETFIREHWAREIAASNAHRRRTFRRRIARAEAKLRCPKRGARARAFHEWLLPKMLRKGLSRRIFLFDSRALYVHDCDLISACEGHNGNFGGSVQRVASGAYVTIYTD